MLASGVLPQTGQTVGGSTMGSVLRLSCEARTIITT